jgi:hypothetical protein
MVGVDNWRENAIASLCADQQVGIDDCIGTQHQLERFGREPAALPRDSRPGRCSSSPPTDSTASSAVLASSTQSRRLARRARASRSANYRGEGARAIRAQHCSLVLNL